MAETLPTVHAVEGPGAGVHVEMDAQVAVRVEPAAAFGTQEAARFGCVLGTLMLQQLRWPGKGGAAVHARQLLQGLLLHVALLVPQELGTGGECALAGQAWEGGQRLGSVVQLCTRYARAKMAVMVVMTMVVGPLSMLF